MRRLLIGLFVACALTAPWPVAAQDGGRLDAVRDEIRGDKPESKSDSSHQHGYGYDQGDDEFLGQLYAWLFISPWVVPHYALGDDFSDESFFRPYPYAAGGRGPMWLDRGDIARNEEITKAEAQTFKGWLARATIDESNDFRGLNRVHGQILFDTCSRFGIQSDWLWLREILGCGCIDDMWLGDINLVYRFAQSEWMQMRSGLGLRMLFDRQDAQFGFNFTYGADIFPINPLVASFVFDTGTVGDAWLFHGRASIGVTYHGWELFAGYDWLRIGSVDLSGPMLGMRLWF